MPSAVIRNAHYEPQSRRLVVEFQSGRRYAYAGVPQATAEAMRRAFSKGVFFNDHIRNRFPCERLED